MTSGLFCFTSLLTVGCNHVSCLAGYALRLTVLQRNDKDVFQLILQSTCLVVVSDVAAENFNYLFVESRVFYAFSKVISQHATHCRHRSISTEAHTHVEDMPLITTEAVACVEFLTGGGARGGNPR
jgi:hypothetical protein